MSQTQSNLSPQPKGGTVSHSDGAILMRVVLVVLLTLTFVGALRWAMTMTQANARQVSRNMMRLKTNLTDNKPEAKRFRNAPGPVIEPE